MKKILILVCLIMLSLNIFTACGGCNHDYEYSVVVDATCEKEGILEKICKNCGNKGYEEIRIKEHDFVDGVCSECGIEKGVTKLPEGQTLGYTLDKIDEMANSYGHSEEFLPSQFIKNIEFEDIYINFLGFLTTMAKKDGINFSLSFPITKENFEIEGKDRFISQIKISSQGEITITEVDGTTESKGYFAEINSYRSENKIVSIAINQSNQLLLVYEDRQVVGVGKIKTDVSDVDDGVLIYVKNQNNTYTVDGAVNMKTENIVIPATHKGLPVVGMTAFAFMNSEIKTVTIPASVTYIGYAAFYGCNKLTNVYYKGTEEQWDNLNIAKSNEVLLDADIDFI